MKYSELMARLAKIAPKPYCHYCAHTLREDGSCDNPKCLVYKKEPQEPYRGYKTRMYLLDNNLLTVEEMHLPRVEADKLIAKRRKAPKLTLTKAPTLPKEEPAKQDLSFLTVPEEPNK